MNTELDSDIYGRIFMACYSLFCALLATELCFILRWLLLVWYAFVGR